MKITNLGFTGTQHGATRAQMTKVAELLTGELMPEHALHVGDCVGADEQAAWLAWALQVLVVGHPPDKGDKRAFFPHYFATFDPLPYLARNRELVETCDALIACPQTAREELRSGTWATVRHARSRRRLAFIIAPASVQAEPYGITPQRRRRAKR